MRDDSETLPISAPRRDGAPPNGRPAGADSNQLRPIRMRNFRARSASAFSPPVVLSLMGLSIGRKQVFGQQLVAVLRATRQTLAKLKKPPNRGPGMACAVYPKRGIM
jgi:hypothetical protein